MTLQSEENKGVEFTGNGSPVLRGGVQHGFCGACTKYKGTSRLSPVSSPVSPVCPGFPIDDVEQLYARAVV